MTPSTLEQLTNQPEKENLMNFQWQKILRRYYENWHRFAFSVITCIFISYAFLRYKTPEYRINASLLVKDDTKGSDFGDAIALESLGLPSGKSNVDNEVEILRSRSLAESVVRDLQLFIQYFAEGDVKTTEMYGASPIRMELQNPVLGPLKQKSVTYTFKIIKGNHFILADQHKAWKGNFNDTIALPEGDAVLKKTGFPVVPGNIYSIRISGLEQTVKKYNKAVSVTAANKMVSLINLVMTDILPEKGERVLNQYLKNYLFNSINDKNRIADSTIAFIDQNLKLVSRELIVVERKIEIFRKANHIADIGTLSRMLLASSGQNKQQQSETDVQIQVIRSLQNFLKENPQRVVPAILGMNEAGFGHLIITYNELQLAKTSLLKGATTEHPDVKNIDQQLENLRGNILTGIAAKQEALKINASQLGKNASAFQSEIDLLPTKDRIFLDYGRQQQIKQELYVFLLKKRVETSLSKSSTLANGRIIDMPKADILPFTPSKQLVILLAILIGFGLPAALIYTKEILNTRVVDRAEVSYFTNAPIITEIGHKTQLAINIFKEANHQVAEQFRVLRTNLQFMNTAKEKVILLTSSMGGEGKSFVAINLAISFTLTGKKVILLEFDFRKPKIGAYLNLKNSGITDYLISEKSVEDFIQKSAISDYLDVLTCGTIPPNPVELMLSVKVEQLIIQLKRQYDYIILDTAPIGIVTDARILSQYADITLFLVRQQVTFKQQLAEIDMLYKSKQLPRLNLVLNDVKVSHPYGYTYGYNLQNKKKSFFKRLFDKEI